MTVAEFRSHDQFPAQWRKELETNYILQVVLGVMDESHPAHFVIPSDNDGDLSPTRAAIELGTTRGYSKYGDTLKLLAKPLLKPSDLPEPTYQPETANA